MSRTIFIIYILSSIFPLKDCSLTLLELRTVNFNFIPGRTDEHLRYYRPKNVAVFGMEIVGDRIFFGTPRLLPGVPATISSIPTKSKIGSSPKFEAFPDWSWHNAGRDVYNCSELISVFRFSADSCGRLWVLDSGVIHILTNPIFVCPPKIVIFDVKTFKPVRIIVLPDNVVRHESTFSNIILDESESDPHEGCDDVFAYIADANAPALIVYNSAANAAWRVTNAAMYGDPHYYNNDIDGYVIRETNGITGLAFSPHFKVLYFQPLTTNRTYYIHTKHLKKGPPPIGSEVDVQYVEIPKSSQTTSICVNHKTDSIYYSPLTETALAIWNPYSKRSEILDHDPDKNQYVSDIRWYKNDPDHIWVLTNRYHRYYLRNLDPREINIRLLRIATKEHSHKHNKRSAIDIRDVLNECN